MHPASSREAKKWGGFLSLWGLVNIKELDLLFWMFREPTFAHPVGRIMMNNDRSMESPLINHVWDPAFSDGHWTLFVSFPSPLSSGYHKIAPPP